MKSNGRGCNELLNLVTFHIHPQNLHLLRLKDLLIDPTRGDGGRLIGAAQLRGARNRGGRGSDIRPSPGGGGSAAVRPRYSNWRTAAGSGPAVELAEVTRWTAQFVGFDKNVNRI